MLERPNVSVFRRIVAAMALSVLVGVTVTAQHTPAWADGTSWSPVDAAAQQQWRSVAYGNGVWVENTPVVVPEGSVTWWWWLLIAALVIMFIIVFVRRWHNREAIY